VAGNPEFAEAHYELGLALTLTGRPAEALPHFREAIRLRPGWPLPLNGAAWILATHRAPELSGRDDALRLAQRASELTGHQDAGVLDTLAAAYAAAGQFDRAITTAEEALRLASGNQADDLVHGIRQRLKLYREGKPYRAPTLEQPSGVDAGAASP
jgi:tetratricopeptide (TPR) repeat protein